MIKKIWAWIKQDGLLHIETSALIVIIACLFLPWGAGGLISLAIGICKELGDIKHGAATGHDIICDLIGIGIGISLINLMKLW